MRLEYRKAFIVSPDIGGCEVLVDVLRTQGFKYFTFLTNGADAQKVLWFDYDVGFVDLPYGPAVAEDLQIKYKCPIVGILPDKNAFGTLGKEYEAVRVYHVLPKPFTSDMNILNGRFCMPPGNKPHPLPPPRAFVLSQYADNDFGIVMETLKKHGFEITILSTGEEAINEMLHPKHPFPYDVGFVNLEDGHQVASSLRDLQYTGMIVGITDLEAGFGSCAGEDVNINRYYLRLKPLTERIIEDVLHKEGLISEPPESSGTDRKVKRALVATEFQDADYRRLLEELGYHVLAVLAYDDALAKQFFNLAILDIPNGPEVAGKIRQWARRPTIIGVVPTSRDFDALAQQYEDNGVPAERLILRNKVDKKLAELASKIGRFLVRPGPGN